MANFGQSQNQKKYKRRSMGRMLAQNILMITCLSMIIVAGVIYIVSRSIVYDETSEKLNEIVQGNASQMSSYIKEQEGYLSATVSLLKLLPDRTLFEDIFKSMVAENPQLFDMFIGFADNTGIYASGPPAADWKATERSWYKDSLTGSGQIVVTKPYRDVTTGNMVITLTQVAGKIAGTQASVGVDINLSSVIEIVSNMKIGQQGYAFLVNGDGDIITHQNASLAPMGDKYVNISDVPAYSGILSTMTGSELVYSFDDYDGVKKYFTYTSVPGTTWTLYAALPSAEVMERINIALLIAVGLFIVMACITAGMTIYILNHRLNYSLRRLLTAIDDLNKGEMTFRMRNQDASDEMGRLYTGFGQVFGTINELIADMRTMAEEHARGNYHYKINEMRYVGSYLSIVRGINNMTFNYVNDFTSLLGV
ncbi:MAG: Cache 3/Cache 2 fusion domain-containing protein, partial [Clostridiales bacterium]|nr:Cache 3/Cache 2 fusion domain-containing protein [Clostridiales bacterium]